MTFSEFRQFLATTSSFRQNVPFFSRSFSAPLTTGPSGIRGSGLEDFTSNSVGRLSVDGKGTGKEAVGYFERLFQRDFTTVERDFDVFTSPRLAVCRPAATVAPPCLNRENSLIFDTQKGKRKLDRLDVNVGIGKQEENESVVEGKGIGAHDVIEKKDPRYSLFLDVDSVILSDNVDRQTDRSNVNEDCGHNSSDGGNEAEVGRGEVTGRRTFSRHFTTSEKVSPKPKRAFYGNAGNSYSRDVVEDGRGDGGKWLVEGRKGREGREELIGDGRGGEKGEEKGEGRGGKVIGVGRLGGPLMYWRDNDGEDEAKPKPSHYHTMCHLDQLEGTEGMRSL